MSMLTDPFITYLQAAGYSATSPRKSVFAALKQHDSLSMSELCKLTPGINRATVYRTVQLFEAIGIVTRLHLGFKYKLELSDRFIQHHHHLVCDHCGRVQNLLEDAPLEDRLELLATTQQFQPTDHTIEVHGMCASCKLQQTGKQAVLN